MGKPQCSNCNFSAQRGQGSLYYCQRYPPTSQDLFHEGFPTVRETTICGEWRPYRPFDNEEDDSSER